ncbi:MAG: DUF1549 domain-containing protein, partial [Planctomycetota bacterium]|nr:DUF1549 domain-containing protein [Planctomycetota bacterium]
MTQMINRQYFSLTLLLLAVIPGMAVGQRKINTKVQQPQVNEINRQIRVVWDDYGLKPAEPASEGEWCRRLYLDLLGRIPSVEELKEFTSSKSRNKREELVNKLLYDEAYVEEYARNWTTIWTNILIGRTGGNDNNSMISREGMQKYLR